MLFQIQKELIQNRDKKVLFSVENDISKYATLKKEYEQLSEKVKKQLTSQLKIYLLLTAVSFNDLSLAKQLINFHNYEKMGISANLALGRFYGVIGVYSKIIQFFLPLFETGKLEKGDLGILFNALLSTGRNKDCDSVLGYALKKYPEHLGWKIEALSFQILISHLKPENLQAKHQLEIVNNLKYIYPLCETSEEYSRIAWCFYWAGFFNDSMKMYAMALQKVQLGSIQKESIYTFDSSKCRASMDEIIDILEKDDVKAFPVFGSLLGLVRDGKFMDYDKDADLGIFVNTYDEICEIVSTLCNITKFISPEMVTKSTEHHKWCVSILDAERETAIDLFFFYRHSVYFEAGLYTKCAVFKWAFTPFELVRKELAGKEYWIPENYEQHLTELYGDWRQPVEVWDSLVNCPNIMSESKPAVLFYGLMRFYMALQNGKIKKALNYYQTLTARWGMRFSAEAEANVRKLLGLTEK